MFIYIYIYFHLVFLPFVSSRCSQILIPVSTWETSRGEDDSYPLIDLLFFDFFSVIFFLFFGFFGLVCVFLDSRNHAVTREIEIARGRKLGSRRARAETMASPPSNDARGMRRRCRRRRQRKLHRGRLGATPRTKAPPRSRG
ncbi:hypothetical protein DsansV1_C11g0105821 [Dioscorea sansibarensis]